MRYIFYILFFTFFINSPVFSDEKVYFNTNTGDKLSIILPKGYCDFSDTNIGKEALSTLKKTLYNQVIEPKLVYKICTSDKLNYPWGYVAIFKQKIPYNITQSELSELSIEGFQDKTTSETIIKDINKNHKNFDTKTKIDDISKMNILWNDKDALIFYTTTKGSFEGEQIVEVVTGSIFLYKQYAYYNYMVEKLSQNNPLKVAQELLNSAKATKEQY